MTLGWRTTDTGERPDHFDNTLGDGVDGNDVPCAFGEGLRQNAMPRPHFHKCLVIVPWSRSVPLWKPNGGKDLFSHTSIYEEVLAK